VGKIAFDDRSSARDQRDTIADFDHFE
jgi:hypothetical protein